MGVESLRLQLAFITISDVRILGVGKRSSQSIKATQQSSSTFFMWQISLMHIDSCT